MQSAGAASDEAGQSSTTAAAHPADDASPPQPASLHDAGQGAARGVDAADPGAAAGSASEPDGDCNHDADRAVDRDDSCSSNSSNSNSDHNSGGGKRGARPKATRLNRRIMTVLFLVLFVNSFTMTMLFPFSGFLVQFFGIAQDIDRVGTYVGLLASSLFLGRFIGSYPWGVLADHWGRRPVLIISTAFVGGFSLMFGFANSYAVAFAARFLMGMLNGIVGTAKAVLSETCDNTNQGKAMSIIGSAWGSGLIVGPAIGGLLYDPAQQYGSVFAASATWRRFPALLPSLVSVVLAAVGVLLLVLYLPETLHLRRRTPGAHSPDAAETVSIPMRLLRRLRRNVAPSRLASRRYRPLRDGRDVADAGAGAGAGSADADLSASTAAVPDTTTDGAGDGTLAATGSTHARRCYGSRWLRCSCASSTLIRLLRDRPVRLIVALYGIFSLASISFDEVYNLWLLSDVRTRPAACTPLRRVTDRSRGDTSRGPVASAGTAAPSALCFP